MNTKHDNTKPLNGVGPGSVNIRDLIAKRDADKRREQKREQERASVAAYSHGIFEGRRRAIVDADNRVVDAVVHNGANVTEPVVSEGEVVQVML